YHIDDSQLNDQAGYTENKDQAYQYKQMELDEPYRDQHYAEEGCTDNNDASQGMSSTNEGTTLANFLRGWR
ncbi:hypothetical protein HDU89_001716, partial [Geranomyces variabilis]